MAARSDGALLVGGSFDAIGGVAGLIYDRMTHNLPDNADYVFDQPLTAIWGFTDDADERGWLVGENGVIGDYSRVFNWGFSKNKTGVMTPMNGIWSPSQNPRTGVAWVVGGQGTIFHHSPTDAWRSDTFTDNDLTSIYGTSADDIWTVGANGTIGHHDTNIAKPWTRLPAGTSVKLYGVWGSAKNDVWAVGEKGTILHYQPERVRQAPTEPPRLVCDQKNL